MSVDNDKIENQVETEDFSNEDDDPIIREMKEAEAEIAAAEKGNEQPQPEQTADKDQPKAETGNENRQPVMIPKERFDQVLSEREAYKQQTAYLQGALEARQAMGATQAQTAEATQQEAQQKQEDSYESLVDKHEQAKLDATEKYENGEISMVELRKIEIAADREIRALAEQRHAAQLEALKKESEDKTHEALAQQEYAARVIGEASKIQNEHPYVSEIDKLPPAIRDGIWAQIDAEATANLAARGINAHDGSAQSHIALIKEKAALTNVYGPKYTGVKIEANTHKGMSETAQQRAAKLDIAAQQPPQFNQIGKDMKTELTEDDIMKMTEDEIADLLETNPNALERAVGMK